MPTYYIDYDNGDDSNSGMSKALAWKRHPYMNGWSGSGYIHLKGDRFIFKGGVTWPASTMPLTVADSGSSDNGNDYYGVDETWYNGGAFTKPLFDAEYSVSRCLFLQSYSYMTIDCLEMKRVTSPGNYGYGLISGGDNSQILIDRCYLHGWRTTNVADDAHGGVLFYSHSSGVNTIVIDRTEIENSENIGVQKNGVCVRSVGTIRRSKIHDNSSGVLFCLDFDDSELYNISGDPFDGKYHPNGVYLDPSTLGKSVGYIRRSRFWDVAGGANMAYPNPRAGASCYVYNCLFYGTMSSQLAIQVDPYNYGSEGPGHCYCYNNTIVNYESGKPAINVVTRPVKLGSLTAYNNHVIGTSASLTNANAANTTTISTGNTVIQTPAQAAAQGYVLGNLYASTRGGATVNTGTSAPSSLFSTDIDGAARPSLTWDIGAYEYDDAPSALSAEPEGSASVSLAWTNNSDNADGFAIERSPNGLTAWAPVNSVAVQYTAYVDAGLSGGTPYYYRVAAYNGSGYSPWSNLASAVTAAAPVTPAGESVSHAASYAWM